MPSHAFRFAIRGLALPLFFGTAFAACGGKDIPYVVTSGAPPSPALETVLGYIENQMSTCSIPGAAIAVVKNGKVVDSAGIGIEDPSTGQHVSPSTLFFLGGGSEPLVDLAALKLVEEGKLDLTHPVTDYVPLELAAGFDPTALSLNEVLLGTSGLSEFHSNIESCGPSAPLAWFAANASQPLWTPPGAVWNFSHLGYGVAGWAVASAASQSFPDAVAQRVLTPAGMKTATYDATVAAADDHAIGQDVNPVTGQITPRTFGSNTCALTVPADGVYASVLDYASLAETLLAGGGAMLSSASVATFETGQVADYLAPGDKYAYGMYEHEAFKGVSALHVGGSAGGFNTDLWIVPESDFAVVVLFNAYNFAKGCSAYDAAAFATQTYLGLGASAPLDWATPPSSWSSFTGTYVDPYVLGTIVVALDGETLVASSSKYGTVTLTQSAATSFHATFGSDPPVMVTFQPDEHGPAGWFVTPYGVGKRQ